MKNGEGGPFRHCLDMTVQSGLNEIAGLTNLNELDISFMYHEVGVVVLDWKKQNWQRLDTVLGCSNPVSILSEGSRVDPGPAE